jgi:hypothetical protein
MLVWEHAEASAAAAASFKSASRLEQDPAVGAILHADAHLDENWCLATRARPKHQTYIQ